jgi:hypothetical protein
MLTVLVKDIDTKRKILRKENQRALVLLDGHATRKIGRAHV